MTGVDFDERAYQEWSTGQSSNGTPTDAETDYLAESVIDWSRIREETADEQFVLEPILAAARSHVVTGPMGGGKSLLLLWLIAMGALGKRVLGRPAGEPLRALTVDAENTRSDILERLEAFGIDPDELDRAGTLRYCHLPNIAHGLDSWKDSEVLVRHAREHRADVVVIDTAAATVNGAENDADTWSALARLITGPLKSMGCALVRVDHPGKDASKGTRGSSAKLADADIAWQLEPAENGGFILRNKKKRMPWIAEKVSLHRVDHDDGTIGWREVEQEWPAGTQAAARVLERLEIPNVASCNEALKVLKAAGEGRRREVVLAAQRYRREAGTTPGTTPQPTTPEPIPEPPHRGAL